MRYLTPPALGLLGVVVVAAILAILLSGLVTGDTALLTFGIAIGILLGAPVGGVVVWLAFREGQKAGSISNPPVVTLTTEQSETLMRALERQQTSPGGFGLTTRKGREITAVGGADLSSIGEESDQGQP